MFSAAIPAAAAEDPSRPGAAKPEDFAGQMTLAAEEGQLMYLELPENVYLHAERRDLGDIRVFDADGIPVPCELRGAPRVEQTPPPLEVAFFPWSAGEENLPRQANIEIDSGGAVIRVNSGEGRSPAREKSFLVDLSVLPCSPVGLTLETQKTAGQWNSPITLRYSSDLARWNRFDKAQTLAGFGGGQASPADRDTVSLPEGLNGSYLLLTVNETVPPLLGIRAFFQSVSRSETVRESIFPGVKSEDGFSVSYAPGGYFPGVALDFILPHADSLNVEIFCRYSEDESWRFLNSGPLWRLDSADADVTKNEPWYGKADAPYWQIRSTGGLPFVFIPDMRLVWEPLRVVFLARGRGKWILAYGNKNYGPLGEALPGPVKEQTPLAAAIIGAEHWQPRRSSGGALRKAVLLWSALVLAVAVLSVLAYLMARSMRKQP
ncbi:MAG: DUF3999 domain-containing protein [Treponema sp.]|nr:DUF3999 domain-containing protein [Treponema sp.]